MSITKAKINLKEGTIELEGSEDFVSEHLEEFTKQMKEMKITVDEKTKNVDIPITNNDGKPKPEKPTVKKRAAKVSQSVAPISLDLKAAEGKPTLKEFFSEKNPKSHMENLTVFAYYLKHYLKMGEMRDGHVVSCCIEVNQKVPTGMRSMFLNIQHLKGWVDVCVGGDSVQITTLGENFVKFDLPRKGNDSKDKTAT